MVCVAMMIYRGLGHELHRWDCVLPASIKLLKTPRVPTTQLPSEQHNTTTIWLRGQTSRVMKT